MYRRVVGKIQFIVPRRPDMLFSLKAVGRYLIAPREIDWLRLERMVRYLVCTKHFVLAVEPGSKSDCIHLWGYGDTDWAGDPETRRSTSCGLIVWGTALHCHAEPLFRIV